MKRILLLILISISVASCSDYNRMKYVCSCEQKEKIGDFVSTNVGPSNNMSDEEMEDVIRELYYVAVKLNCEQRLFVVTSQGAIDWDKNTLDSCETVEYF